jgi:hypothetical protein
LRGYMPRSKTVILAGQEYSISQLNMRANKEFREHITEPANKIIALVQNYQNIEINSAADIAGLIMVVKDVLFGSMDLLLDSLFAYAPELAADRERIEQEAYDDEAIAALGAVAALAYPFGQLVSVWGGPNVTLTSTNSALPNGAAGTKKQLAGHRKTT